MNTDNETHPILVQAMLGEEHTPEALSNLISSLRVPITNNHESAPTRPGGPRPEQIAITCPVWAEDRDE